jgi:hypothetical protein
MPNKLTINKNDVTLSSVLNIDPHTLYHTGAITHGSLSSAVYRSAEELICERLDAIESHLGVLSRERILESRFPRLKEIADEYYRELEKLKTWERISK